MPQSLSAFVAMACCGLAGAPAAAGEVLDVALTQDGVGDPTEHPVTPTGHDFFMGVSEWEPPQPEDAGSPFHGLRGACFGVTEYQREDLIGGGGYCTYQDAGGDRLVTRWTPTERLFGGVIRGEWPVFEGSGRWAGATGGGAYEIERRGVEGERRRKLTGQVTLR